MTTVAEGERMQEPFIKARPLATETACSQIRSLSAAARNGSRCRSSRGSSRTNRPVSSRATISMTRVSLGASVFMRTDPRLFWLPAVEWPHTNR
jgi:hypothetical protein